MIDSSKDLVYLAAKAALACGLAMLLDRLVGNPDSVSSTFVAILSISPVVLIGVRLAWSQLLASALGGLWGALALALSVPALLAVPLAVGLAIVTAYLSRVAAAYPVAAFTALYLVLVPRATPLETLEVRLLAVTVGAVAGFVVNVTISSLFYRPIFRDRVARAERATRAMLADAARVDDAATDRGFARLTHLLSSLHQAKVELTWRHAADRAATIAALEARVEQLRYLLHLSCRLGYQARETGLDDHRLEALAAWLRQPSATPPDVPPPLEPTLRRMVSTLDALGADATAIARPWQGRAPRSESPPA